jgi:hypothetical protein
MCSSAHFPRLRLFVVVFLVLAVVSGCAGSVLGNIAGGAARAWSDRRTDSFYQFTSGRCDVAVQPRLAWAGKGGVR